jgi:HPt (histidine-containing phosphotransfer) domain-containing protein
MSEFNAAMDALAQRFLVRCGCDLAKLKELLADSSDRHTEIWYIVHRMSGSAGIFGFNEIGDLAGRIDGDLAAGQPVATTDLPGLIEALATLLAARKVQPG